MPDDPTPPQDSLRQQRHDVKLAKDLQRRQARAGAEVSPGAPAYAGRVTVTGALYWQPAGRTAKQVSSAFSAWLGVAEQLYERELTVTDQWAPLDRGWVDVAAMLLLRNEAPSFGTALPTEEQRAAEARRVVDVALLPADGSLSVDPDTTFASVPPGQDMRLRPENLARYAVRCREGAARVTLYLIPS